MPTWLIAGFFLPLFPFSMPFNWLFARTRSPAGRALLLLLWPQLGLRLLHAVGGTVPDWVAGWALATAALYALRLLTVRELNLWTGFLATSAWALLWLSAASWPAALGLSAPLVVLALVAGAMRTRLGAAYAGLAGGQVADLPRLAGVFALAVLAATATPLFPGFAVLLRTMLDAGFVDAWVVATIWLLWSWAGMRLLRGFLVGEPAGPRPPDLGPAATWGFALILVALLAGGAILIGGLQ